MAAMNFVTFNQDHSHLGVGTSNGYRIYTTDPFNKQSESREGDVSSLEMLFSTSLVALTLSPRVLRIQNTKRHSTICEMTFRTAILAMRLNRKRLVVVLESELYIYDISNMQMLKTEKTSPNPNAICALSASSENNYLVYPLPTKAAPATFQPPSHAPPKADHVAPTSGEVLIYDATKMEAVNVIEAHNSPLSCIALNNDGTLLATASEKGTIIRVFSIPDAQKLYQFRRGSIPARIYSMSFNSASTLLSVSSATETVHIFRLGGPNASQSNSISSGPDKAPSGSRERSNSRASEELVDEFGDSISDISAPERKPVNPTFASMIRRTSQTVTKSFAATVGGYLPSAMAEIWEPARDFAWVKIPRSPNSASSGPMRTVVALSNNGPQVMVVTSEGSYYIFNMDLEKGGEGTLYKQFSLLEPTELTSSTSQDLAE
ncbi:WD repeat domain phosphoinositide-interacting protein 2 [Dothidotthia symphoricarpi CBS 119687]|uniref:WD repeat domain phosphoinositide-interacting protein 2 n=1 Tax=Dothidotthia symphoricarpi CBS 119687 TaxID=1392245 RepID=A0A6A6ACU9_9PLEO|nr:WD repeat domain phosphoinositide-interacting protein 2 [Dothidotthia symphoricarpi CBS 119687]KAF2129600.1 WD repeat domain phosphoinositide-interacting protein 2 [Dothidotthia symphoricarpi CBS 119687]